MKKDKKIYFVGFMGTGKSTISRELGEILKLSVVDTDSLVEEAAGMPISQIFEEHGEVYFRNMETETLENCKTLEVGIISCGGGIPLKEENQKIMKETGTVILLTASPQSILERVKGNSDRPLLAEKMNLQYITELMENRRWVYEKVADIIVNTEGKTVDQLCLEIVKNIDLGRSVDGNIQE